MSVECLACGEPTEDPHELATGGFVCEDEGACETEVNLEMRQYAAWRT